MTLTPEERRAKNRENARKSTGPKTDEGKRRARANALKHGLRAESIGLPNEDPAEVAARIHDWQNYYQPASPAAVYLLNQCVKATFLSDRCQRYHTAALSEQVRKADENWKHEQDDELERLKALLTDDPYNAVRFMKRTATGCQWLADRWERLGAILAQQGCWCASDRDEAIRLQGVRPEPEFVKRSPESFLTRLRNAMCDPKPSEDLIRWLCHSDRMPEMFYRQYSVNVLPDPADCRSALRDLIDNHVIPLREAEERLRIQHDLPNRAEAADRALILADHADARRFLRYHSESRTAFHRAFSMLVKTLQSDAENPVDIPDDPIETAPSLSPNEAISAPIVASEPIEIAPTRSPNEAILAAVEEPTVSATAVAATDSVVIRLPEHKPSKRARKARERAERATASRRAAQQGITEMILERKLKVGAQSR
jgi:hypothetical protein